MIISDQRARKVTISQMMSYFEYDFNVLFCFVFFVFFGKGGTIFFLFICLNIVHTNCKNDLLHMLNVVYHVQVYM